MLSDWVPFFFLFHVYSCKFEGLYMCTRVTVANPSAGRDVNIEKFCKIMGTFSAKAAYFMCSGRFGKKRCPSAKKKEKKEMVNDYGK